MRRSCSKQWTLSLRESTIAAADSGGRASHCDCIKGQREQEQGRKSSLEVGKLGAFKQLVADARQFGVCHSLLDSELSQRAVDRGNHSPLPAPVEAY